MKRKTVIYIFLVINISKYCRHKIHKGKCIQAVIVENFCYLKEIFFNQATMLIPNKEISMAAWLKDTSLKDLADTWLKDDISDYTIEIDYMKK